MDRPAGVTPTKPVSSGKTEEHGGEERGELEAVAMPGLVSTPPARRPSAALTPAAAGDDMEDADDTVPPIVITPSSSKLDRIRVESAKRGETESNLFSSRWAKLRTTRAEREALAERGKRINFVVHGKRLQLAKRPLWLPILDEETVWRKRLVWLVEWNMFERFILTLIVVNSVMLALLDYSVVDGDGVPTRIGSARNAIVEYSEILFTPLFTLEAVLKVSAMGFCLDAGSYLRDPWNWLDFSVVLAGVLRLVPGFPKISVLRTFRLLRPLRSLTVIEGMRQIVSSLLLSIPGLVNVMGLLLLVLSIFTILGVQVWGGILHGRCRLTPFPVRLPPPGISEADWLHNVTATPDAFRCLDAENDDIAWQKSTSPWAEAQDCFWPMAEWTESSTQCPPPLLGSGLASAITCPGNLTCGSNWDHLGNARFKDETILRSAEALEDLNWGVTSFDHFFVGLVAVFQCVTLEGWSSIMYRLQDTFNDAVVAVYFSILVLFGSFFLLNLSLAVIFDTFTKVAQQEAAEHEEEMAVLNERAAAAASRAESAAEEAYSASATARRLAAEADAAEEAAAAAAAAEPSKLDDGDAEDGDAARTGSRTGSRSSSRLTAHESFTASAAAEAAEHARSVREAATRAAKRAAAAEAASAAASEAAADAAAAAAAEKSRASSGGDDGDGDAHGDDVEAAAADGGADEGGSGDGDEGAAAAAGAAGGAATAAAADASDVVDEGGDAGRGDAAGKPQPLRMEELPPWRAAVRRLVEAPTFVAFITLLILVNTLLLALDHHPMEPGESDQLEMGNFVLTLMFTLEMLLKLAGLGWRGYIVDRFNVFDGAIVIISLLELLILPPAFLTGGSDGSGSAGGAISALRSFRLFRVFKLARNWTSLATLLDTISHTLPDVANFAVLLLLFMYISALLGLQFFANRFHFHEETGLPINQGIPDCTSPCDLPRAHFDSFLFAFVTIFQVLSGEDWNVIMYDGWRAAGAIYSLYFITLVVVGNLLVLNLFLAILLNNFEEFGNQAAAKAAEDAAVVEAAGAEQKATLAALVRRCLCMPSGSATVAPSDGASSADGDGGSDASSAAGSRGEELVAAADDADGGAGPARRPAAAAAAPAPASAAADGGSGDGSGDAVDAAAGRARRGSDRRRSSLSNIVAAMRARTNEWVVELAGDSGRDRDRQAKAASMEAGAEDAPLTGVSLFFMPVDHPVRAAVASVVRTKPFATGIYILIFISCLTLALENPLNDPDSGLERALRVLDIIITTLFTLEMLLKVITYGFLLTPTAYLRSSWNVLDFLIVVFSLLSFMNLPASELLRALKALRAARPLRMITVNPGLRLVVNALFSSLPAVLNVVLIVGLVFLIFGIVGVNYFKGTFYACDVAALPGSLADLVTYPKPFDQLSPQLLAAAYSPGLAAANSSYAAVTSRSVCEWLGASWDAQLTSDFDNVLNALLTLFEMSTTEGWTTVMWAGVDARGIDMQPVRDSYPGWVFFFIGFIVIGSFFVVNLFVGVVIDNFNRMKEELGGYVFLTEQQREWVRTQEMMLKINPSKRVRPPSHSQWRMAAFRVVRHRWFDIGIMICIVANSIVLGITYFGAPDALVLFVEIINYLFAAIFTAEAVLKISALSASVYFQDGWNRFDFAIVCGTLLSLLISLVVNIASLGAATTVIRIFRVLRAFRLIKQAKNLRRLIATLTLTLPSLGNVGSLLALLFFMYTVIGVQLFAKVAHHGAISGRATFTNFWGTLLLMTRASTGEAWNSLMHDLATDVPGCVSDPPFDASVCGFTDALNCTPINGCGTSLAYPFFYSFTILITFVLLNLFIAIILEGFSECEQDSGKLTNDQFQEFVEAWSEFDPDADCFAAHSDLPALLRNLAPPLGVRGTHHDDRFVVELIDSWRLQRYAGDMVHFGDVARCIARRVLAQAILSRKGVSTDVNLELPPEHPLNTLWAKKFSRSFDDDFAGRTRSRLGLLSSLMEKRSSTSGSEADEGDAGMVKGGIVLEDDDEDDAADGRRGVEEEAKEDDDDGGDGHREEEEEEEAAGDEDEARAPAVVL